MFIDVVGTPDVEPSSRSGPVAPGLHRRPTASGAELVTSVTTVPLTTGAGLVIGVTVIARAAAPALAGVADELLDRTFRTLAESLDLDQVLERTAAAFVPALGEVCLIHSLEPGALMRMRSAAATEPAAARLVERMHAATRPLDPVIGRELIDAGRRVVHEWIDVDGLRGRVTNRLEAELAILLGSVWHISCPLRSRNGIWGFVTLLSRASSPGPQSRPFVWCSRTPVGAIRSTSSATPPPNATST